jgi:hypothetical protein
MCYIDPNYCFHQEQNLVKNVKVGDLSDGKLTRSAHAQICNSFFRLIKHTETLLEEKEEKLCVKVLKTLREMMAIDPEYGEKVKFC